MLPHAQAAFFVLALGLTITYAVWQTTHTCANADVEALPGPQARVA